MGQIDSKEGESPRRSLEQAERALYCCERSNLAYPPGAGFCGGPDARDDTGEDGPGLLETGEVAIDPLVLLCAFLATRRTRSWVC